MTLVDKELRTILAVFSKMMNEVKMMVLQTSN